MLVNGSSEGGTDIKKLRHKQATKVIVGVWCITVIELIMQQQTVPHLTQSQLCGWKALPSVPLCLDGKVIDVHYSGELLWPVIVPTTRPHCHFSPVDGSLSYYPTLSSILHLI